MKVSKQLKQELGNAIAAYGQILNSAALGTHIPAKFEGLNSYSIEELKEKMRILKEFYYSLEEEN